MVLRALERATADAWPSLWWCDPDFQDWPLEERAVCEALQTWALAGGRLRMLATDFAPLQARAARFVAWRRLFNHRFEARATGRPPTIEVPSLLIAPDAYLWRADNGRSFVISGDLGERTRWMEQMESLWQQSTPSFPATTLGL